MSDGRRATRRLGSISKSTDAAVSMIDEDAPWFVRCLSEAATDALNVARNPSEDIDVVRARIEQIIEEEGTRISPALLKVIKRGLLCSTSDTAASRSFLAELAAALEFSTHQPDAGRLSMLRGRMGGKYKKKIIEAAQLELRRIRSEGEMFDGSLWFSLRSFCMDMCCVAHIVHSSTTKRFMFYGGENHAKGIFAMLKTLGFRPSSLSERAKMYENEVTVVYYLKSKTKRVFLLGENHSLTRKSFDAKILSDMKSFCFEADHAVEFLIEKHPFSKKDFLQQELTCNMPHLAIHRVRCGSDVERVCPNFNVVAMDTRHVDLGFLRYELISRFSYDPIFVQRCREFQEAAIESFMSFAAIPWND